MDAVFIGFKIRGLVHACVIVHAQFGDGLVRNGLTAVQDYHVAVEIHGLAPAGGLQSARIRAATSTADILAASVARGIDAAAVDGDRATGSPIAAADARSVTAAGRHYDASGDTDPAPGSIKAAADARSPVVTLCRHDASGDADIAAVFTIAAADARCVMAAGRLHAAAAAQGQGGTVGRLEASAVMSAF